MTVGLALDAKCNFSHTEYIFLKLTNRSERNVDVPLSFLDLCWIFGANAAMTTSTIVITASSLALNKCVMIYRRSRKEHFDMSEVVVTDIMEQ